MERIEFDLLFRWFVGIGMDDPGWEATTFTKNRDRLLAGEIAGSHQRRRHWLGAKRQGFVACDPDRPLSSARCRHRRLVSGR